MNLIQMPNDWLNSQAQLFQELQNSGQQFVGVQVQQNYNPNLSVPVIYGLQRVEGPILFLSTQFGNTNNLYMVISLGEGQLGPVYRLFVDGIQVFFDNPGVSVGPLVHNTVTLPQPGQKFRPTSAVADQLLTVEYIDGRSGNIASTLLKEVYNNVTTLKPPIYENAAYLVLKFVYRDGVYSALPKVTVDIFGMKTRSCANITSGAFTSSTIGTDFNPVNHLLDYMTSSRYGCGIADSSIDLASFKTVYDYIETTLVRQNPTSTGYPIWSSFITLDTTQPILNNLNAIKQDFGIILTYSNGKYRISIENQTSTVYNITDADILDAVSAIRPSADVKYNSVTVDYIDVSSGFLATSKTYPLDNPFVINAFVAEDGNRVKNLKLSANSIGYSWQAEQMARRILFKSRSQDIYTFTLTKTGYQYTVGDVLNVTTTIPVLTNQQMRIISMKINTDFTVEVECIKHDNAFYPAFSDIKPNFGSTFTFPPNSPGVLPLPTPPSPGDIVLPGDPGGQPAPTPQPIITTVTAFTMSQIYMPYFRLSLGAQAGATQQAWPFLTRGASTNNNFYLGPIFHQVIPSGATSWSTISGSKAYAPPSNGATGKQITAFYSRTAEYSFGVDYRVDRHSPAIGNEVQGGSGSYFAYKMSPVITYRYHDTSKPTDPNNGKYKNNDFLVFVYTLAVSGGTTTKFGFERSLPGNVTEQFVMDLENSETVQWFSAGSTKPQSLHWTQVADRMPRMRWTANTNGLGGGYYGGIDNADGRTCVQNIVQTLNPTTKPGINAQLPSTLTPTSIQGSSQLIKFKIFSIGEFKPEYLGEMTGTTWVSMVRGADNFATASVSNYKTATGITLPLLT